MYEVETGPLIAALDLAQSVIGMGGKSDAQSVTLTFDTGLQITCANSVVVFRSDIPVVASANANMTVTVLPDVLKSFTKGQKSLTLTPTEAHLQIKGGKRLAAEVYYIGVADLPPIPDVEPDADLEPLAARAAVMLQLASSIRNRTDKQELSVRLQWTTSELEMTIGDSHHVAVLTATGVTAGVPGSIAMTQDRLAKVLHIGKHFAQRDNEVFAWRDTEFLSIVNQATSVRSAETAKEAIAAKKKFLCEVDTVQFASTLDSILGAVDDTAPVDFTFGATRVLCAVETASSRARAVMKPTSMKGPETRVRVSVNHLRDCLGALRGPTIRIALLTNNIVSMESTDATKIRVVTAMATRPIGQGDTE